MNKKELVEFIFDKLGKKISRKIINDVTGCFMDGILKAISKGDAVKLVGFINIGLRHYGPRQSRNPRTGAVSQTPASVKAFAKLGTMFKDATKNVKPSVQKAKSR